MSKRETVTFEADVTRQLNSRMMFVIPLRYSGIDRDGRYRVTLEPIEELKPCPFCGGELSLWNDIDDSAPFWVIECVAPDCLWIRSGFKTSHAAADWVNRREG